MTNAVAVPDDGFFTLYAKPGVPDAEVEDAAVSYHAPTFKGIYQIQS